MPLKSFNTNWRNLFNKIKQSKQKKVTKSERFLEQCHKRRKCLMKTYKVYSNHKYLKNIMDIVTILIRKYDIRDNQYLFLGQSPLELLLISSMYTDDNLFIPLSSIGDFNGITNRNKIMKIFSYLDLFLDSDNFNMKNTKRNIVVIDYVSTGSSLSAFKKLLNLYLEYKNIDKQIKIFGYTGKENKSNISLNANDIVNIKNYQIFYESQMNKELTDCRLYSPLEIFDITEGFELITIRGNQMKFVGNRREKFIKSSKNEEKKAGDNFNFVQGMCDSSLLDLFSVIIEKIQYIEDETIAKLIKYMEFTTYKLLNKLPYFIVFNDDKNKFEGILR